MSFLARLKQTSRDARPAYVESSFIARLGIGEKKVEGQAIPAATFRRPVVSASEDLERVVALLRRKIDLSVFPAHGFQDNSMFDWLKRENKNCFCASMGRPCARELLPVQAWALYEASIYGKLLGAIGVGHGKELLCELLPLVLKGTQTALLFIPSSMREAFALDWEYYGQHWKQPNLIGGHSFVAGMPRLKAIAYSELSHEKFTAALAEWRPDLIIANEAHALCALNSVRTRRVLSYCAEHPECKFIPVSGTLTKRSIADYAHLSALALGEGSPLPIANEAIEEWGLAVDPPKPGAPRLPARMGALEKLCAPGETAREGFRRRFVETCGVIATVEGSVSCSLEMRERVPPPLPGKVREWLDFTRGTATRPDGEELVERSEVARCLREIASGFYYRWIYPRGEPEELILEWFRARQAWNREVRELLTHPRPYLDSPLLAVKAAIRQYEGSSRDKELPRWPSIHWPAWRDIRKKVAHETEAVWIDDWLAKDAAEWAVEKPGIVWYANVALGQKVAELSGLKFYGGGPRASEEILRENGKRSIIVSMKAHATGKNLQAFSRNLVAETPPDASLWEQLLGRTHRTGQAADCVEASVYRHTAEIVEAFRRAEELAEYVQQTTPNKQKLLYASYSFPRK